jgi:hypothetical protein
MAAGGGKYTEIATPPQFGYHKDPTCAFRETASGIVHAWSWSYQYIDYYCANGSWALDLDHGFAYVNRAKSETVINYGNIPAGHSTQFKEFNTVIAIKEYNPQNPFVFRGQYRYTTLGRVAELFDPPYADCTGYVIAELEGGYFAGGLWETPADLEAWKKEASDALVTLVPRARFDVCWALWAAFIPRPAKII